MRVDTKVRWTCVTWKVSTSLGLAYFLLKNQPCCLLFANYCLYYCLLRASGFVFFSPYFPTSQNLHLFTPVLNLYTTELWNTPKIVAIRLSSLLIYCLPVRQCSFIRGTNRTICGREPIVPTANVLGGGSSVNFLLYSRAQRSDFDSWQVPGWSAMELLPYMRKVSYSPLEKQRSTINNLIVRNIPRSWP